jgi:crossover junction endodeoxyribonuclease RuvC
MIRLTGEDFSRRLGMLQLRFAELVRRVEPSLAAVESPFHGANPRSALQLAHARGVVLATLAAAGVAVAEYTPATVKKSVTGNGRATKQQVRAMVFRLLAATPPHGGSDLSDALAVALCHQSHRRVESAQARAAAARGPRRRLGGAGRSRVG